MTVLPLLVKVPLSAVELAPIPLPLNSMKPPPPVLLMAPSLLNVALLAVEVSLNSVRPPFGPLVAVPLLIKVALPALEVLLNSVMPALPELAPELLVKDVLLPAVELLLNCMIEKVALEVTKFCVIPELFVMPVPLIVNVSPVFTVMVNALAPELKMISATCVLAEMETPVVLETSNVATSDGPLG